DADLAAEDEARQGELMGVGEVELQTAPVERRRQERLAAGSVGELDLLGTTAGVGGGERPQGATPHHVLPAVLVEPETVGTLPFVGGEGAAQALHPFGSGVEMHLPDVDLAGRQLQAPGERAGRELRHRSPGRAEAETSARSRATASRIRSLVPWMKK